MMARHSQNDYKREASFYFAFSVTVDHRAVDNAHKTQKSKLQRMFFIYDHVRFETWECFFGVMSEER